ncbi:hypothetical protein PE066_09580 [Ramlibacter tataouinensis]|uniref:hypothetical protein n=1 Tax=Ramlibacter tataouinensis TaxID=94132 RepID=UPI0022F3D691|nr:hypothetical protein [Ramlibacter tataouinensis]WBY03760.1 hypothetical protein PE066_09580 [Ramlibacter tataouinensis]
MNRSHLARLAALTLAAVACGPSLAADNTTLNVSATVQGVCKLYTSATGAALGAGTLAMAFTLDPSVGGAATQTTDVFYKCTSGTSAIAIQLAGAGSPYAGTLTGTGTALGNSIPYSISWTNPATAGAGFASDAQFVTLTGTIAAADYIAKLAGPYGQNVPLTLTP